MGQGGEERNSSVIFCLSALWACFVIGRPDFTRRRLLTAAAVFCARCLVPRSACNRCRKQALLVIRSRLPELDCGTAAFNQLLPQLGPSLPVLASSLGSQRFRLQRHSEGFAGGCAPGFANLRELSAAQWGQPNGNHNQESWCEWPNLGKKHTHTHTRLLQIILPAPVCDVEHAPVL